MSVLRYEKPRDLLADPELPSVFDALLSLGAILVGAVVLGVVGLGTVFCAESRLGTSVGFVLLLLVLLGSPVGILLWVVQPMWNRCWRHVSPGALLTLILGVALIIGWYSGLVFSDLASF